MTAVPTLGRRDVTSHLVRGSVVLTAATGWLCVVFADVHHLSLGAFSDPVSAYAWNIFKTMTWQRRRVRCMRGYRHQIPAQNMSLICASAAHNMQKMTSRPKFKSQATESQRAGALWTLWSHSREYSYSGWQLARH